MMRNGRRLLLLLGSAVMIMAYGSQAGAVSPDLQLSRPERPRLAAVERLEDINRLQALVDNYNKAWEKYNNTGDREVFNHIKPGSQLSDLAAGFSNKGLLERVSGRLLAVDFADDGRTAWLKVFESVTKWGRTDDDRRYSWFEYHWAYKAERQEGGWLLTECVPLPEVLNKFDYGPRRIVINRTEYLLGDWVYYANPYDGDKLYQTHTSGLDTRRLGEDSVRIADLTSFGGLMVFNKSQGNELWLYGWDNRGAKKAAIEFSAGGWDYFSDRVDIYRVNAGQNKLQRLYARSAGMKTPTIITEIRDGWVYFFFYGESGKRFHRVKTDGTACEYLPDAKGDWRDGDR